MPQEFCPQCGTARTGALRFCRSCAFDFDSIGEKAPPVDSPPVTEPTPSPQPAQRQSFAEQFRGTVYGAPAEPVQATPPRRRSPLMSAAAVLAVVAVGLVIASAITGQNPSQSASGDRSQDPDTTPRPTVRPISTTPARTPTPVNPEPPSGTGLFAPGEVLTVTSDDEPYLDIVVSKVREVAKYDGEYDLDDTPEVKGNVFIELFVSYTSLQDGASYNLFDWSVFVDDKAVDDFAFVMNGPEPQLSSGNLPNGRQAEGWLVYEVPKTGRVVLSYGGGTFSNDAPVFEVVLRAD